MDIDTMIVSGRICCLCLLESRKKFLFHGGLEDVKLVIDDVLNKVYGSEISSTDLNKMKKVCVCNKCVTTVSWIKTLSKEAKSTLIFQLKRFVPESCAPAPLQQQEQLHAPQQHRQQRKRSHSSSGKLEPPAQYQALSVNEATTLTRHRKREPSRVTVSIIMCDICSSLCVNIRLWHLY